MKMNPELKDIQKKFNKVLAFSQGESDLNTDQLFEDWCQAKRHFIDHFGALIYELPDPVTFQLNDEERKEKLNYLIQHVEDINGEVADFLNAERAGIFENKVAVDYNVAGEIIPAGMKIGKAIHRYFSDTFLEAGDEEWLIKSLAQMVQEDKVTGKLCLSVHPLDYLSVSENCNNWRSCHALDGEYRVGNLNYMVDDCTVIAYLKSDDSVVLPRFPEDVRWNNKKWRCLFFFDFNAELVYAGRQYPFFSRSALDIVGSLFMKFKFFCQPDDRLFLGNMWEKCVFKNLKTEGYEIPLDQEYIAVEGHIYPLGDLVKDGDDTFHYNDLLRSTCYIPYVCNFASHFYKTNRFKHPMIVGRAAPCIKCGKKVIGFSDAMFCRECIVTTDSDCDELTYCARCGERIVKDDDYNFDGEYYCQDCYESMNIAICTNCGEYFRSDDMVYIKDNLVCRHCARNQNWHGRDIAWGPFHF